MSAQPNLVSYDEAESGVHVLVIGVSAYRHLPGGPEPNEKGKRSQLKQLNGPAKSASNFAAWMLNKHHHSSLNTNGLKSLRVLLSPADGEDINPDIQALIAASGHPSEADSITVSATIAAFQSDCADDRDSMAVVYVCGHGVQIIEDGAKMLLSDYASPNKASLLDASLDLNKFYAGLYGHKYPQTQYWFYDCCGQKPAEAKYFESLKGGIGLDKDSGGFVEVAPIFMSASEDTLALGKVNENSFFCQSVLWALDQFGAASVRTPEYEDKASCDFIVTTGQLNESLKFILNRVAMLNGGSTQFFRCSGRPNPGVFHEYDFTLTLPTRFSVKPDTFVHQQRRVTGPYGDIVQLADNDWPIEMDLDAGLYVISVQKPGDAAMVPIPKTVAPSSHLSDLDKPALNAHTLEFTS